MPRCIEWKALVKVNGVAWEEYAVDKKDSDDSVTSWIVSEEGQHLGLRCFVFRGKCTSLR